MNEHECRSTENAQPEPDTTPESLQHVDSTARQYLPEAGEGPSPEGPKDPDLEGGDERIVESPPVEDSPKAATQVDAMAVEPGDPIEILTHRPADADAQTPERAEARRAVAQEAADEAVRAESRRHTRRSFVAAAAAAAASYGFYRWIEDSPGIGMQPAPLRRAFEINAAIAGVITGDHALAPTYSLSEARDLRVNGIFGLKQNLVPESWRLQVVGTQSDVKDPRFTDDVTAWQYRYTEAASQEDQGHDTKVDPNMKTAAKMAPEPMLNQAKAQEERMERMPRGREEAGESRSTLASRTPGLLLTMGDVLALRRYELVTQFKCIEGWSQIVHWAGVRMADFIEAYPPGLIDGKEPKYVYMETPDGDYYTGYDLEVCRHPQTLLVTEMMGTPLTQFHGAPLRLHMPTKYGYKQIKRIGLISYTNEKPDDYWTKLGYDWFAGL